MKLCTITIGGANEKGFFERKTIQAVLVSEDADGYCTCLVNGELFPKIHKNVVKILNTKQND